MFTDNHIISFEPISERQTSLTFWRATTRELYCIPLIEYLMIFLFDFSSLIYISNYSPQVNCTTEWRKTCVMITDFTEMNGRGLVSYFEFAFGSYLDPMKVSSIKSWERRKRNSIFENSISIKVLVLLPQFMRWTNILLHFLLTSDIHVVLIVHGIYFWLDLRLLPCPVGISTELTTLFGLRSSMTPSPRSLHWFNKVI